MNKKDLKKIEDKLSDIEVSDSVLDKARNEIQNSIVKPKTSLKFNYKILLSCAASLVLCLAIILPITFSALKNNGYKDTDSDKNQSDLPQSPDGDASAPGVTEPPMIFILDKLDKKVIYGDGDDGETGGDEPEPPSATEIVCVAQYRYFYKNMDIITEERYSINGSECVLYVLHNALYEVDVLDEFVYLSSEYVIENSKFNYSKMVDYYLAETFFGQKRYCFKLNSTEEYMFDTFCNYVYNNF